MDAVVGYVTLWRVLRIEVGEGSDWVRGVKIAIAVENRKLMMSKERGEAHNA